MIFFYNSVVQRLFLFRLVMGFNTVTVFGHFTRLIQICNYPLIRSLPYMLSVSLTVTHLIEGVIICHASLPRQLHSLRHLCHALCGGPAATSKHVFLRTLGHDDT